MAWVHAYKCSLGLCCGQVYLNSHSIMNNELHRLLLPCNMTSGREQPEMAALHMIVGLDLGRISGRFACLLEDVACQ